MPASLFFLIHTMNTIQTIIIAIIEGITEFLPISSTAHMKFANPFLGIADSPFVDLYEIVIQFAAILSVVVIYRKEFFNFKDYHFYLKLLLAVLPALLFGALLKKYIDAVLDNLWVIATVMVLGGIALIFIDRYFKKQVAPVDHEPIQFKQAFWVGCFQVLAIVFPGLSRSAATIIGGLSQKIIAIIISAIKQITIHDIFFHIILIQILLYYFLIKKQSAINIFFAKKKFVKVDKWI